VHLVEALVYGLAGGKKQGTTSSVRHPGDFPDIPLSPESPINFPAPQPSVPIRGAGLNPLPPLPKDLPRGMVGPAELLKRNQEIIVNRARRKVGLE
jgi:hypothetical protein